MKNLISTFLILGFLGINSSHAAVSIQDYKDVVKTTKIMCKLSDKNNIDELSKYYSLKYKSFDGYNKDTIIKIYKLASDIYPDLKSKSQIKKVEVLENDDIKVYVEEKSKTRMDATGEDAIYSPYKKVKGIMNSTSDYSMVFRKEDDIWLVIRDEIYEEKTDIRYGEAIGNSFEMEIPENIVSGKDFEVKVTLKAPGERYILGSIGHDEIVFPPEKHIDPYRTIDDSGILERILTANNEGKNEYINSTYAIVAPYVKRDKKTKQFEGRAAISGMGFLIKRVNTKEELL